VSAHPFRIHAPAALARLASALRERAEAWLAEWFGDRHLEIVLRNVEGSDDPLLRALPALGDDALVLGGQREAFLVVLGEHGDGLALLRSLLTAGQGALLPGEAGASLAGRLERGVAERALQSLYERLSDSSAVVPARDLPSLRASPDVRRIFRRGSGWTVLDLVRDGRVLPVLLGPELLQALLPGRITPRRGDLPRARAVLAAQRISLRAYLGNTTLTVGQVKDLAVGDVVKLDQRFDARVRVGTADRQLAQGQLGVSGGRRALRLAPV
jgi:hypothetical protein